MSKLEQAMNYVDEGLNPHAAAVKAGMKQAGQVYAEIKRRKLPVCPECGSKVEASALSDLSLRVSRVLDQLDYTAKHSEDPIKRGVCESVAVALRG